MGLFDKLWGTKTKEEVQQNIRFGRYTDSYKLPANYEAWEKSLVAFQDGDYLESYCQFFKYLRDEQEDNVRYRREDDRIVFELFQGSKKIIGFADDHKVKAEAKIAKTEGLNVGFMRRLIEKNFSLEYSRFCLDHDDNICILFDTYTLDGSPYKLYHALKEVATNADKQDDLLLDEFRMLQEVDTTHLKDLDLAEKEAKYAYISEQLQIVLREVEEGRLPFGQYPGAYVYLLLAVVYKLDYLTRPEGYLMERLEFAHRQYFSKDGKKPLKKAKNLVKELKKLLERSKEAYFKEMYHGKSTFGITVPVNHDRVVSSIENELVNMDWYLQNGYHRIALGITGFIVGYCLFNYAVPKPTRELLDLYYRITEPAFFASMGFQLDYYDPDKEVFNKRAIKKAIQHIVQENKAQYPKLRPAVSSLAYTSMPAFAKSYLLMIRDLDVSRIPA